VLLLDEPTTGLGAATESRLLGEMPASIAGKTVILVTHQARLAAMAGRLVTLDHAGSPPLRVIPRPAARPGPGRPGAPASWPWPDGDRDCGTALAASTAIGVYPEREIFRAALARACATGFGPGTGRAARSWPWPAA
jgi:energy-coupling factor transporter ATP-binding protein EcfA2